MALARERKKKPNQPLTSKPLFPSQIFPIEITVEDVSHFLGIYSLDFPGIDLQFPLHLTSLDLAA